MSESQRRCDIDKQLASWINTGAMIWYMKIHDTVDWARGTLTPEQRKLYCRAAARVLGFTTSNLLDRIYVQHPDLVPKVFRQEQDDSTSPGLADRGGMPSAVEMTMSDFSKAVLGLAAAVELNLRDIISIARLSCSPETSASLETGIGEILEQVGHWRSFVLVGQYEANG